MNDVFQIMTCGLIATIGAVLLKYRNDPLYRFTSASLMMGAWLCTAGIALRNMQECAVYRGSVSSHTGRTVEIVDVPITSNWTLTTKGGNVLEIRDGLRDAGTGIGSRTAVAGRRYSEL